LIFGCRNIQEVLPTETGANQVKSNLSLASEAVSLEQAIRAYTIDAAWQLRLEDHVVTLQAGKQAGLVVLSNNLFEMTPHNIHTAKVLFTMMNGRVVHDVLATTDVK
jgi:hypothetical protein